jgi:hypothetical protein
MLRATAVALVALAAFDHIFMDGRYAHSVQMMMFSLLHFFR